MSTEFKRYVNFPKGSWWVYDTIGGYDTITVYRSSSIKKKYSELFDRYEDGGTMEIIFNSDTIGFLAEVLNNGGETIENLRYIIKRSQVDNSVLDSSIMARYGNTGWENLDNQPYTPVWLEKLDSFNNGFQQFGQTIKSIKKAPDNMNHRDSLKYLFKELYWTENIGLTRFITTKGTTYNLVNYEIK